MKKLRSNWEEQITRALEEGRVLQALRFSAQPPEPTARFPAALVGRLASSAGAAMSASTPVERWLAILDAAVSSPIRRQIHPEGLPDDPSGEVVRKARVAAGSLPALAPMLGLPMPPPPKPLRSARPARPPRPPRPVVRTPRRAAPTGAMASVETRAGAALTEAPEPAGDAPGEAPKDEAPTEAPEPAGDAPGEAPKDEAPTEAPEPAGDAPGEAPKDEAPTEAPEPAGDAPGEAPLELESSADDALPEAEPEEAPPASADSPS